MNTLIKDRYPYLLVAICVLATMSFLPTPSEPNIELYYGTEPITHEHPSFSETNGTDWGAYSSGVTGSWSPYTIIATKQYTIKNTGSSPLELGDISIEISGLDLFSIDSSPSNSTINSGESATISIGFRRKQEGRYGIGAAKINIESNDPDTSIFTFYMVINSLQCSTCTNDRHTGELCNQCKKQYDQASFPSCDTCVSDFMISDCTACVFPGQDYEQNCEACLNPSHVWPRCFAEEENN